MQTKQIEIVRRHVIHYACGCSTTRIEVQHANSEWTPVCAGHLLGAIKEELITEYQPSEIDKSAPIKLP